MISQFNKWIRADASHPILSLAKAPKKKDRPVSATQVPVWSGWNRYEQIITNRSEKKKRSRRRTEGAVWKVTKPQQRVNNIRKLDPIGMKKYKKYLRKKSYEKHKAVTSTEFRAQT